MFKNIVEQFKEWHERWKDWRDDRREAKERRLAVSAIAVDYAKLEHVLMTMFGDIRDIAIYRKSKDTGTKIFQFLWRKNWKEIIQLRIQLESRFSIPVKEYFPGEPEVAVDTEVDDPTATGTDGSVGSDEYEQGSLEDWLDDWIRGLEEEDRKSWEFLSAPHSDHVFSYNDMVAAQRTLLGYKFFSHTPMGREGMERFLRGHSTRDVETMGDIVALATVMVALLQAHRPETVVELLEEEEVPEP